MISFYLLFNFNISLVFVFSSLCSDTFPPQRRKTNNKPRDASTPHGSTAAESVRNLIKKNPKYSKRINYDALKDLFIDGGGPPSFAENMGINDDKDDAELYTIGDEKSDDDGAVMVIIEEEPGSVAVTPAPAKGAMPRGMGDEADVDGELDGDEGSDDDKGDDVGWEYEQEI
jgi:transcription factor IIIB subunit 2